MKNNLNQRISVLVTQQLAAAVLLLTSAAHASVTFTAGSPTAVQGSPVTVPITVSGFTDVSLFQFNLQWSEGVLQYSSVGNFAALPGLGAGSVNNVNNTLIVSWDNTGGGGSTLDPGVPFSRSSSTRWALPGHHRQSTSPELFWSVIQICRIWASLQFPEWCKWSRSQSTWPLVHSGACSWPLPRFGRFAASARLCLVFVGIDACAVLTVTLKRNRLAAAPTLRDPAVTDPENSPVLRVRSLPALAQGLQTSVLGVLEFGSLTSFFPHPCL